MMASNKAGMEWECNAQSWGVCERDERWREVGERITCSYIYEIADEDEPTRQLTKKSNAIRNTLNGSKRILMVDIFDIPLDSWSEDKGYRPGKEK